MDKGEERILQKAIYKDTPNKTIAKRLGCSVGMVAYKARFLKLRKDPEYLSATNRQCGIKTQYRRKEVSVKDMD